MFFKHALEEIMPSDNNSMSDNNIIKKYSEIRI